MAINFAVKLSAAGLKLVPLLIVFELSFLLGFAVLLHRAETLGQRHYRAIQIVAQANIISSLFKDDVLNVSGYLMTKSPLFEDRLQRISLALPAAMKDLETTIGENHEEQVILGYAKDSLARGLSTLTEAKGNLEFNNVDRDDFALSPLFTGSQNMRLRQADDELGDALKGITFDERHILKTASQEQRSVANSVMFYLLFGGLANIAMLFLYTRIERRLNS